MSIFDEPDEVGNGVRLYPKDIVGHLLLVWAVEYIAHSPTTFTQPGKPSDVIVVDAVDLDAVDPETSAPGLLARRTWWRQAQLIKMLKLKLGNTSPLLVRMGKGGATMGRNAPFVLVSQTQDALCVQRANLWLQANADFVPSKPMPAFEPPVEDLADPWAGQQPTLPAPRPPTVPEKSMIERMAEQGAQGRAFADQHHSDVGKIPF